MQNSVLVLFAVVGIAAAGYRSPPEYHTLGCYKDSGERDLGLLVEARATTVYRCRDQCRRLKYRYSGNQYSDQCWCGNTYGRYGKDADSQCQMKCNANPTQLCGGVWHQHIYTTGVGEAALSIRPLGCYQDRGDRDLPFLSAGPIDVNSCLKRCRDLGYPYAGVQYGSQCWCGSTYGRYGKGLESACSMKCAANLQQICGGVWHSNIYETGFVAHDRENLGCYIDQGERDMVEFHAGIVSIEFCVRYCRRLGYKYAAVQYASSCFCGNKYGRYGTGDPSTCNMPCNGKGNEICGGVWRNNVYATGREPEVFGALGCFNDKPDRDLPFLSKAGSVTINNCWESCSSFGFLYFGVQNGDQCFCGNSFGKHGKADDTACTRPCVGNKEQTCGGTWLMNIYRTNVHDYLGYETEIIVTEERQ